MEFKFTVRFRLRVSTEAAFAFFQDPKSMLYCPDVIDATGTPGESGVIWYRQSDGLPPGSNTWRVLEYKPPFKAVVEEHIVAPTSSGTISWTVIETDRYRACRSGCSLKRTMCIQMDASPKRQKSVQRLRDSHKSAMLETVQKLTDALMLQLSNAAQVVDDVEVGPPRGPYLSHGPE